MAEEQFDLLRNINSNVVAIFWQTKAPLAERPLYFTELDYLFNGLLSMHLSNNNGKRNKGMNFFASTNFGQSIFLAHECENEQMNDEKVVSGLIELCGPNALSEKSILLICDNVAEMKKKFHKKFPKMTFLVPKA
jgi:hypothetical protein